jgi:phage minor structural protein
MIYVLSKAEEIVDILEPDKSRAYWNDTHVQDLKEGIETFDFDADVDIPTNSTIVLKTPTNDLIPFIVQKVKKVSSSTKKFTYYCDAEFLELRYSKILEPEERTGQTPLSALSFGLQGTRWEVGNVEEADIQTVKIDEYMNTLKYLRTIATSFDLELRFRVEFANNRIARRYVDFKKRVGLDAGKEIVFGKDLESIERVEDSNAVVTALYGIGPADSEGNYMGIESVNSGKKYVEDLAALQRWGKNGEHRFDIYTPSVADEEMTPQKLYILTKKELNRRIAASVQYQVDAEDLYDVIGKRHEAVFLGDTVRIKDEGFEPALYLEARVLKIERSYTNPSSNKFTLGEYREINPKTYDYIRDIQKVLNGNKNKWNTVDDLKDGLDGQSIKISEINHDIDGLNITVGEIKDTNTSQSTKISQIEIDVDGISTNVSDMQIQINGNETLLTEHSSAIDQNARNIELSVKETDFNGETIASKLNIDAYSIELDTAMINLLGITNVANTLNIGESYDDSTYKEINFRGPYGGARMMSPDMDIMQIYGRNNMRVMGKNNVEVRHADGYGYALDFDVYADTTFHGNVSGLETYYTGSQNGQDLSFAVTSTGSLQIFINGAYRGYIPISNFS